MRAVFIFLSSLLIGLTALAQPKGTAKLYGYQQSVSRGKAPDANAETGIQTNEGAGKNYFLYAVSSSRVYPVEIWVAGIRMGVTIRSIAQTPVYYSDETNIGSPKKLLVPKTSQKVVQLIVAPPAPKKIGTVAKAVLAQNDVVLVYKEGGKFYYSALPSLQNLDGVAAQ